MISMKISKLTTMMSKLKVYENNYQKVRAFQLIINLNFREDRKKEEIKAEQRKLKAVREYEESKQKGTYKGGLVSG